MFRSKWCLLACALLVVGCNTEDDNNTSNNNKDSGTCVDKIQNQGETGVDCGGPCPSCAAAPSCFDGIQNQDETGTDCGGTRCFPCMTATCVDGIQNQGETGTDCGGPCPACTATPTCSDGAQNQGEADVDCGGPCPACSAMATCADGMQNGNETGVDCGGSCPNPCMMPASCMDNMQNGDETGVDCGGPCMACQAAPTCSDNLQNQGETGIDCGGPCAACIPEGFILLQSGAFSMGSPPNEVGASGNEAIHTVTLSRRFYIKTTPVTQSDWIRIMGNNPSFFQNCGGDCPVENISWYEAIVYANNLSKSQNLEECYTISGNNVTWSKGLDCKGYRLPIEAEWEYAVRAGDPRATYNGNLTINAPRNAPVLNDIAVYSGNSGVSYAGGEDCSAWVGKQFPSVTCGTQPVKGKRPNNFGVYDMIGNTYEWAWDTHVDYSGDAVNPIGGGLNTSDPNTNKTIRGCSWNSLAAECRAAFRFGIPASSKFASIGFRVVRSE